MYMKTTKFLCLVDTPYFLEGLFPEEVWNRVNSTPTIDLKMDDAFMRVIECIHPDLKDNMVEIEVTEGMEKGEKHEFLRDKDGMLWYVDQVWTRMDIIKRME